MRKLSKLSYNNIFISIVSICICLFWFILINIYRLLPDQSHIIDTYSDANISYENFSIQDEVITYHPHSIFDVNGYRHKLFPEEAQKYLNSDAFASIKTAMTKYSIYHENCTLDEILPELKYNAYICDTPFGKSFYIDMRKSNLFIYFTLDGKNVSYYYLNDLSTGKTEEVKLDYTSRQFYIQECKNFLSIFSKELADAFSPDMIRLDSYGIVYTLQDTKNHITIEYWIVKNKPLGFKFGYTDT